VKRVLIVDDDEGLLRILGDFLSVNGFDPELVSNVAHARSFLAREKFDAVLSDFKMPGESGLDLLSHVKALYSGLPFILMTGAGGSRLKQEAMRMGCNGYIEKPFRLNDLLAILVAFRRCAGGEIKELAS